MRFSAHLRTAFAALVGMGRIYASIISTETCNSAMVRNATSRPPSQRIFDGGSAAGTDCRARDSSSRKACDNEWGDLFLSLTSLVLVRIIF